MCPNAVLLRLTAACNEAPSNVRHSPNTALCGRRIIILGASSGCVVAFKNILYAGDNFPECELMKSQGAARVFALVGLLVVVAPVQAQESAGTFPSKPIRIIVGNAAGGGTDTIARLVGQKISDVLGQPIVVENKPGGSNMIAAQYVAKSPADGYTLLMGSIGMLTINPAVFASVPYDTMRDFAPISLICSYPLVLTVNANTPVRDVQELVAYIKANPEKANAGGTGTIDQIAAKMFELRTERRPSSFPIAATMRA
jgi:tripartite-type tricarboxylate transporter receptor subunit TctC